MMTNNIYILELNFLFLLTACGIICYRLLLSRIIFIKSLKESSNPYIHELRIRYYLFDIDHEILEENQEYIFNHFKLANTNFFTFKLQYL